MRSLLGFGFVLLPFLGTSPLFTRLAEDVGMRGGRALSVLAERLPQHAPLVGLERPSAPSTPAVSGDAMAAPPSSNKPKRKASQKRELRPADVHVGAAMVLALAERGIRPGGRSVPASGRRPRGVAVAGAGGLGLAVRDGDVITAVDGVPVASTGEVIALVIAARGRRARLISATVYRGEQAYRLTVEQPYLEALPKLGSAERGPSPPETASSASPDRDRVLEEGTTHVPHRPLHQTR